MFLLDLSIQTLLSSKEHVHCFDSCYNINHFEWNWNWNSGGFVFFFRTNKNSFVTYCIHQGPQNNLSIGFSLRCPGQNKVTLGRVGMERIERVMSWEECSSLCREKRDCKYWTWYSRNNRIPRKTKCVCVTMTNARNAKKGRNTWSGTRECGGEILKISSSGPLHHVSLLVCRQQQKMDPEGPSSSRG